MVLGLLAISRSFSGLIRFTYPNDGYSPAAVGTAGNVVRYHRQSGHEQTGGDAQSRGESHADSRCSRKHASST